MAGNSFYPGAITRAESAEIITDPAESAQRSATIDAVVAIRGGGFPPDQPINGVWLTKPTIIDGRRFVDICASSRIRIFLQHNWAMVKHIKNLRDRKSRQLMQAVIPSDDPNGDNVETSVSDRPRRELIDFIPNIIDIEVDTLNGIRATVSVVPSWREKQALQIELTTEGIELLLEEPPAASARFLPDLSNYPNVSWISDRNHVRTVLWDSGKKKWRTTSMYVDIEPDATTDEAHQLVLDAAGYLENYRARHHNLHNNMPESGDDEPPQKKVRNV